MNELRQILKELEDLIFLVNSLHNNLERFPLWAISNCLPTFREELFKLSGFVECMIENEILLPKAE